MIITKMAMYTFQFEVTRHMLNLLVDMDVSLQVKYPVSVLCDITLNNYAKIKSKIKENPDLSEQWEILSGTINEMIATASNTASEMLLDDKIRMFLLQQESN